jgi:hypothetical protein
MRIKQINGMLLGDGKDIAEKALKEKPSGSIFIVTARNGFFTFVNDHGTIRPVTEKEYQIILSQEKDNVAPRSIRLKL